MSKIAFLFPGQGAQYVGMGKELYDNFEEARSVFKKSSEQLGYDVADLCFNGTEEQLKVTEVTQPTILTVSIAAMEVLKSKNIFPSGAAGLSMGEYGALVAADSISVDEVFSLVSKRGKYMQEAVPLGVGAMAAILGLERDKVIKCCEDASDVGEVSAANFNCPGQIVISGHAEAVNKACEFAKQQGARRTLLLPVSAPFHSTLLKPAGEKLKLELKKVHLKDPKIPVISNVTADIEGNTDQIFDLLVKQVSSPVMWQDCVLKLLEMGYDIFIEVGPGKTLSNFMRKIKKDALSLNVENMATLENTVKALEG